MPIVDIFGESAAIQLLSGFNIGDGSISLPISGIAYTLRDTFSTDLAAGSINATLADTGQARTVTDTNAVLSITGGVASAATGGVGLGNPGLWYPSVTRSLGLILMGNIVMTTGLMNFGWDSTAAGNLAFAFRPLVGNSIGILDNNTTVAIAAAPTTGIVYQMAVVLRGTGAWYFIKGGAFTVWTLVWISTISSSNLLPGFVTSGADVCTVDEVRIPQGVTLIPQPLAYDTFTRADGALGSTEIAGPDAQVISALAWTFTAGIWTISTNKAIATPAVGADVIVNGAFAADTDWTKGSGWAIGSGTANATTASSNLTAAVAPLTVGRWYQVAYTVSGFSAGTVKMVVGGVTTSPTHAANATYTETMKAGTTAFAFTGAGFTGSIDDVSAKLLVTAELFSSVQLSVADVMAEVAVTITGSGGGGVQAGLVLNLDSTSNPQNFILVYLNGNGSIVTEECVAGVYTTKATTSATYAAGGILRVAREGTQLRVFYNGGTAGTVLTMTANTGTLHGLFATSPLNSLDNFLVWPRGTTSNDYAALGNY